MLAAILGHIGDAGVDRLTRRVEAHGLAVDEDLAGVGRRQPEEDFRQLRPSRSHEAGEAEDLAPADRQRHVGDAGRAVRQLPDLQRDLAERDRPLWEDGRELPADHQGDETARSISARALVPTVSPSRSTVMRSAMAKTSSRRCEM